MSSVIDRRQFAKPVGLGVVVFASDLGNPLSLVTVTQTKSGRPLFGL